MIPGEGIFLGHYTPRDRDGHTLGKVFDVFAAPEDLTDESGVRAIFKYVEAVTRVTALKGWHGSDGGSYVSDTQLYAALKDGSYRGEWVIPPRDLLDGMDVDENQTQPDNLVAHRNKGAFSGTFTMAASGSGYPSWYWSSTEKRDHPSYVYCVRLSYDHGDWDPKDGDRLSCRPVRLVEVPSCRLGAA